MRMRAGQCQRLQFALLSFGPLTLIFRPMLYILELANINAGQLFTSQKAHTSYNRRYKNTNTANHILPDTCTGEWNRCYHITDDFQLIPVCFISLVAHAWRIWALEEVIFHIADTIHLPAGVHTPVEAVPAEVDVTLSRNIEIKSLQCKIRILICNNLLLFANLDK